MDEKELADRYAALAHDKVMAAAWRLCKWFPERIREDKVAEFSAKCWDQWRHWGVKKGTDPYPQLRAMIGWAWRWVRYDRRLAGRSHNIDITDYRAGLKQQQITGQGRVRPLKSEDPGNHWINWVVRQGREDDPAQVAEAKDEMGLL